MTADRYGTTAAVVTRTGVRAEDLNLDSDVALSTFIEATLDEATDLMDRFMRKSYLEEDVPAGLNAIAADMVAAALKSMVQTRQTPVVRIDDFDVRINVAVHLTPDIKSRLKLYAAGRGVVTVDMGQDSLSDFGVSITAAQLETMDEDLP